MINFIRKLFGFTTRINETVVDNKYVSHNEAVIIACYYNPQRNPYRLKAFNIWYDSIKHLNHRIIECTINNSMPDLWESENIEIINTESNLWHKEALLNRIIKELPKEFKYVFWLDTDVLFENKNWLVDSVNELQTFNIIQPFEYCVHLDKERLNVDLEEVIHHANSVRQEILDTNKCSCPSIKAWKSFCSNHSTGLCDNNDYNLHGHVGFAWGIRREILGKVELFDKGLIGGADHIIAHAATGKPLHNCITKAFTHNLDEIEEWGFRFYKEVQNKVSYVPGILKHIWHGDIGKREYLKRIQEFSPSIRNISHKDKNGLYVTKNDKYVKEYMNRREDTTNNIVDLLILDNIFDSHDSNNSDLKQKENDSFGGGNFGGGGSGSSWEENKIETQGYVDNSNMYKATELDNNSINTTYINNNFS